MTLDANLLNLFGAQHGVARVQQLSELGIDRHRLRRWRRSGLVIDVAPTVVALAGSADSFERQAMTALLAGGGGAALCSFTAGALWGLRQMPRASLHVLVHETQRPSMPDEAVLHRSFWYRPASDAVERLDGLRVTTPLRTLFTLAADCRDQQFERAAEDMWRLGLVSPSAAAEYLEQVRGRGRGGTAVFDRWVERFAAATVATQSGLEHDLERVLTTIGLPEPRRQWPLALASGIVIHLDLAWPEVRLAVEPGHRWFHGGDDRMRSDYERDRQCAVLGWQVIRFDDVQLRSPLRCARAVLDVYRTRRRRTLELM